MSHIDRTMSRPHASISFVFVECMRKCPRWSYVINLVNELEWRLFGYFRKDERSSPNKDTGQRKASLKYPVIANYWLVVAKISGKSDKKQCDRLVCISFRLTQYLCEGQTDCNPRTDGWMDGWMDGWIECGSSSSKLVHAWGKLVP